MRWAYHSTIIPAQNAQAQLNHLGLDGWELVAAIPMMLDVGSTVRLDAGGKLVESREPPRRAALHCLFKRPVACEASERLCDKCVD